MRALGAVPAVAGLQLLSGQRPVYDYPLPDQTTRAGTAVLVVSVAFFATVGAWLLLRYLWFAVRRFDETGLWLETQDAVSSLDREPVVYVEEFVHAFDAHVAATGVPPPRRDPPPAGGLDPRDKVYLITLGVYLGVLVVFSGYLIRIVWLDRRAPVVREQGWRVRTNARLNRLADLVLRTEEPSRTAEERAEAAKRYVLLLRDVESAATEEEQHVIDRQLIELERSARISKKRRKS